MKIILLITSYVVLSSCSTFINEQWTSFKKQHSKSYQIASEEQLRIAIFTSNLKMVEEHNAKFAAGLTSYRLKLNSFSDLFPEEVKAKLNGFNKDSHFKNHNFTGLTYLSPANVELPQTVDWRQKGAVTPVKDQGDCGSCWAFSAAGAIEGQLFRKTGKLVSLSEQQLIDCSLHFGNVGCHGGLDVYAFNYVEHIGGMASEESYPYLGKDGSCKFRRQNAVEGSTVRSHVDLPPGNELALQSAVATVGPVAVAVSAASTAFLQYGGGIFTGEACIHSKLDHAVLVVGYGTEDGQDYWIVKNSWNTGWGEEGYVRLARNRGNVCGIASMATYPVL